MTVLISLIRKNKTMIFSLQAQDGKASKIFSPGSNKLTQGGQKKVQKDDI